MASTQIDIIPNHDAVVGQQTASSSQVIALQQQLAASEDEARDSSALLELLAKLQAAESLSQACRLLVNDLRAYLNCGTLAIAVRRGARGGSSLRSISGMAEFDRHSELARQFESACDEAVHGDRSTTWPPIDDSRRHATLALKALCAQTGATSAICALLRDTAGDVVGCWLILNIDPNHDRRTRSLSRAFAPPVANCLAALRRQQSNLASRAVHFLGTHARTRMGWFVAALIGLAVAAMFVPATHKIKCECRLEPVTRRFVAAPFEGTLEEALAEPGDLVAKGALLARLDGREIRWKQAELVAQRARAAKQRDAELAAGKFGAAQISKLEMQRIDLQIQLLEHRAENLDIRSPIAGVITSGDLQRAQGAPLTLGQTLFEVAPLDAMLVEIAIPQDDIRFVRKTSPVKVQLDSHAGQTWQLTVERVQPRAELRDQQNVFIGTALLENQAGQLRPGMEGTARVIGGQRPVGWLLFHKPWDALRAGRDGNVTEQGDFGVREIGNTLVTLRADLIVSPRQDGTDKYYVLQDPLTSKFFRLGLTEYTFASLLDGGTSIHQALSLLSTALPNHTISPQDATGICHWLLQSNLAHTPESASGGRLAATAAKAEQRRALQRFNPLVFKLPLGNPNRLFERIAPLARWLYSPLGVAGWLLLMALAGHRVAANWQAFSTASREVFAPDNWIWLGAGWLFLKIVHELAHGTVCKKYGGHVRESGILFVVLAPLAYVDVTSSWQFRSRWQRIYTAAAGMHIELLVAAIAALVWNPTGDTQLNHVCVNLVLMSSVTTLLFNANPLMKFDGYYILSDLTGIPNLNVSAQQYLRGLGRSVFLGMPRQNSPWTPGRSAIIRTYAILAFLWRIMVTVSLTVAASLLFHGAGIVLAGLAIVLWLGLPTFQFLKYMVAGRPGDQPNLTRFTLTFGTLALVVTVILTLVPWPGALRAPAIVAYSTDISVRAASPGFVAEVLVESGQRVTANQPLAMIDNPEISAELADLKLAIEQSTIQCRVLKQNQKLAEYQAEVERHASLEQQRREKQLQVDNLTVRAPDEGTFVATNVESLVGTYLREGMELGVIGDPSDKNLRVSIGQDDLAGFKDRVGESVSIVIPNAPTIRGRLHEVDPRASVRPSHAAFCAVNRGPIAVRHGKTPKDGEAGEDGALEYLAPRFVGVVDLARVDQRQFACGQLGIVCCRPFRETIGQHLLATARDWLARLQQRGRK